MEMEDKESTESGSPGRNSDSDSQPSSGGVYGGHGGGPGGGTPTDAMNMEVEKSERRMLTSGGGGVLSGGSRAMGGGGVVGSGELVVSGKKKRGRPRKYDENGKLTPSYIKSPPGAVGETPLQPGFTLSTPLSYRYSSGSKRGRGKSLGSGTWKIIASLGELLSHSAGGDFTPHVVTVFAGEDVAGKIVTFAQKGPGGICVLSANGSVSNVTLRQPGTSGGLLTYEGRFEILTLTGSFTLSENGKMKSQTGGLSVSLASADGRVIGGGVAGMLMAANPIQVVVGSFVPNVMKLQKRKLNSEPRIATPPVQVAPPPVTAAIPISQESPKTNAFPFPTLKFPVQIQGAADHSSLSNKDNPVPALTNAAEWNGSGTGSVLHRPSPDINISIQADEH